MSMNATKAGKSMESGSGITFPHGANRVAASYPGPGAGAAAPGSQKSASTPKFLNDSGPGYGQTTAPREFAKGGK